jgi:hypothetical protein
MNNINEQMHLFIFHPDRNIFESRVARWYVFKPKIPIWVKFGGPGENVGMF